MDQMLSEQREVLGNQQIKYMVIGSHFYSGMTISESSHQASDSWPSPTDNIVKDFQNSSCLSPCLSTNGAASNL